MFGKYGSNFYLLKHNCVCCRLSTDRDRRTAATTAKLSRAIPIRILRKRREEGGIAVHAFEMSAPKIVTKRETLSALHPNSYLPVCATQSCKWDHTLPVSHGLWHCGFHGEDAKMELSQKAVPTPDPPPYSPCRPNGISQSRFQHCDMINGEGRRRHCRHCRPRHVRLCDRPPSAAQR